MNKLRLSILVGTMTTILILSGCKSSIGKVSDELEIKKQMTAWVTAWESVETDPFRTTMKSEGIDFTLTKVLRERNITIDEFIKRAVPYRFLLLSDKSGFKMGSVELNETSSILYGEWNVEALGKSVQLPVKATFEKIAGTWLIASINIGGSSDSNDDERNVEFDKNKYNAYISFKVDGKRYVYRNNYGSTRPRSWINASRNCYSIMAFNLKNDERIILTYNYKDGGAKGTDKVDYPAVWHPEHLTKDGIYEYAGSDFFIHMDTFDQNDGLVTGNFAGHVFKESMDGKESVYISEGFFYVKQELTPPVIKIKSPTGKETVSGEITLSGTVEEDSEIRYLIVVIKDKKYNYGDFFPEGLNDWKLTFDTTQYPDGEYVIDAYAIDEHLNSSPIDSITINIANSDNRTTEAKNDSGMITNPGKREISRD